MKFDRDTIVAAVAQYAENGGVILRKDGKRAMPKYLGYNGGLGARGGNKGQIGPNRVYNQGMKGSNYGG